MTSVLSTRADGYGFHYGFAPDDRRQINVRRETDGWRAWVGGEQIEGVWLSLAEAEASAIAWLRANPDAPS